MLNWPNLSAHKLTQLTSVMYSMGGAMSAFVPPLRINVDASGAYNKQGRANCISRQTLLCIQEEEKT